ncbi:unnamed protein product [Prorocentrum cordatum]|uniref:Uncharacterized protein n=1 Tax=Prorocentrum cordatum TaxID=2364126 RepID=A0ABN9S3M2_9DINO|nr:unnamed protein product [Polarella glacialis]
MVSEAPMSCHRTFPVSVVIREKVPSFDGSHFVTAGEPMPEETATASTRSSVRSSRRGTCAPSGPRWRRSRPERRCSGSGGAGASDDHECLLLDGGRTRLASARGAAVGRVRAFVRAGGVL